MATSADLRIWIFVPMDPDNFLSLFSYQAFIFVQGENWTSKSTVLPAGTIVAIS